MDYFGIDRVYCGPIPHGRGTLKTAHGIIPNPAPVTLKILSGLNMIFLEETLELTTPTGAAIIKHYAVEKQIAPPFKIEKIGYGVGTYKTDKPDVLRIFIGKTEEASSGEDVWVIEADMDDMATEYVGIVADKIRREGALDVLFFPVFMKKGRMGIRLSVTTKTELLHHLMEALFTETTTFGLRLRREQMQVLKKEEKLIPTSHGPVRVNYGYGRNDTLIKTHIEFEDVKNISEAKNIPYRVLLEALKLEVPVDGEIISLV
jgi:pyridinium-3,5-bisthiocarboxylic acid mononucleotide nickel chelatase